MEFFRGSLLSCLHVGIILFCVMGITAKLDRKKCKIRILASALRKLPFHKGTSLPWIIDIVAVVSTKKSLHFAHNGEELMANAVCILFWFFFFFLNGKKICTLSNSPHYLHFPAMIQTKFEICHPLMFTNNYCWHFQS